VTILFAISLALKTIKYNKIFDLIQITIELKCLTIIKTRIIGGYVDPSRPIRDTTAATADVWPTGASNQSAYDELRAAVWTAIRA
jgi:hypothetical protein